MSKRRRRDPHSLLNWTRRMLAVRRRFSAFGRGTLRFLYPGNRKILAFLRELHDGETDEPALRRQSVAHRAGGGARSVELRRAACRSK